MKKRFVIIFCVLLASLISLTACVKTPEGCKNMIASLDNFDHVETALGVDLLLPIGEQLQNVIEIKMDMTPSGCVNDEFYEQFNNGERIMSANRIEWTVDFDNKYNILVNVYNWEDDYYEKKCYREIGNVKLYYLSNVYIDLNTNYNKAHYQISLCDKQGNLIEGNNKEQFNILCDYFEMLLNNEKKNIVKPIA